MKCVKTMNEYTEKYSYHHFNGVKKVCILPGIRCFPNFLQNYAWDSLWKKLWKV